MASAAKTIKRAFFTLAALASFGCANTTIPLVNITGTFEHPWVWPYFLDGKPTVLAFWSTNEMQCLRDVPALKTLEAREGSVQLVTVVTGRDRYEIERWLWRENIRYPVLLDLENRLCRHLGVDALPTFVYFDTEGHELDRRDDIRAVREWFDSPDWLARSENLERARPWSGE